MQIMLLGSGAIWCQDPDDLPGDFNSPSHPVRRVPAITYKGVSSAYRTSPSDIIAKSIGYRRK